MNELDIRIDLAYIASKIKLMNVNYVDDNDRSKADFNDMPLMYGSVYSKEVTQDYHHFTINLDLVIQPPSSQDILARGTARSQMGKVLELMYVGLTQREIGGKRNKIARKGYYSRVGMKIQDIDNGLYSANKLYNMTAQFDIQTIRSMCVNCSDYIDGFIEDYVSQ